MSVMLAYSYEPPVSSISSQSLSFLICEWGGKNETCTGHELMIMGALLAQRGSRYPKPPGRQADHGRAGLGQGWARAGLGAGLGGGRGAGRAVRRPGGGSASQRGWRQGDAAAGAGGGRLAGGGSSPG